MKTTKLSFKGIGTSAVGVVAALLVAFMAFTGTASAASPCVNGRVCLWSDHDWSGSQYFFYTPAPGCYNLPTWFNDVTSSVANYSGYRVELKADANCVGGTLLLKSYWEKQDLAGWPSFFNDVTTSVYIY
jgi:hypothetical protein